MFEPAREYRKEHGCLHCKYRSGWQCKLDSCNLENNNIVNAKTNTYRMEIEYDCTKCPYKKDGDCYGFCIKKVLYECNEIWVKNKKRGHKNG
jgi:hypothetical protein